MPNSPAPEVVAVKRVTKRRAETRDRMLEAAFEVFAEEGFGRSTIEQICDRAGYTRGAFYSNFSSLDALFLAMWEKRSAAMLDGVRRALAARESQTDLHDVRAVVEHVLRAVPVDDGWYRITAEFTAHALRNPSLRRVMAAREEAIVATLATLTEGLLNRMGRKVLDIPTFGQALIAVHDGTAVQCLLEPDNPVGHQRRLDLFTHVFLAYSVPTEGKL